jgi:hypothetical protein
MRISLSRRLRQRRRVKIRYRISTIHLRGSLIQTFFQEVRDKYVLTGYEVHIARCIFWNKVGSATIKLRSFDDNKAVKRTILTKRSENNLKKIDSEKRNEKKILDSGNYLDYEKRDSRLWTR